MSFFDVNVSRLNVLNVLCFPPRGGFLDKVFIKEEKKKKRNKKRPLANGNHKASFTSPSCDNKAEKKRKERKKMTNVNLG